jgi:hypothetical protein
LVALGAALRQERYSDGSSIMGKTGGTVMGAVQWVQEKIGASVREAHRRKAIQEGRLTADQKIELRKQKLAEQERLKEWRKLRDRIRTVVWQNLTVCPGRQ